MRRNQLLEKRVWVIMGLLTVVACESGEEKTGTESQPELSIKDPPADDEPDVVDEEEEEEDVEPEPEDAGVTSLDASSVDSGPRTTPDAATKPDASVTSGPSAAFLRGQALADTNACKSCHQANYAGLGYFPNITPHPTAGIGAWTDKQIASAITDGVNEKGEKLCAGMTRYELNEAQVADLVAFLRGLTANAKVISPICPGHNM